MKKFLTLIVCCLISGLVSAQTEVTKFMGIPIDGTKREMVKKLEDKGFELKLGATDILLGEFNGMQVEVHIVTQKNKVYRIMVVERNLFDAPEIKTRYNNLCLQFGKNQRYAALAPSIKDYLIQDDEDLDYEMLVNDKRYQAAFIQLPENIDSPAISQIMLERFSNRLVWVNIAPLLGQYALVIYYDNGLNQANGEDL